MEINKDNLRGHWKNENNDFMFSFYPQNNNVEDFKCSINVDNSGKLLHDGDVYLEPDNENNECVLKAGEIIFIIKSFDKENGYMSIFNKDFGTFEVIKN